MRARAATVSTDRDRCPASMTRKGGGQRSSSRWDERRYRVDGDDLGDGRVGHLGRVEPAEGDDPFGVTEERAYPRLLSNSPSG